MRSTEELIELINQYEADGDDLCELGEEVNLLTQSLIDAGDVNQALTLMGAYTEVDWDDYLRADGYWEEHNQFVEILMQMGEQDSLENPHVLFNSHKSERPMYFRIAATINPHLQELHINELLDELVPYIGEEDMMLDEQFMLIGLVFNKNLSATRFTQTFELLDLEMMEYVLSLAQGSAYTWGWCFQYAQEFIAESKNIQSGKKRVLEYISNSGEDFLTPTIRYSDVNLGSKDDIISAIDIG
jgi:hypothetical protein